MKALFASILILGTFAISTAHAAAPANAPAGSTGLCKDGTWSSSDTKKGACRGHKGVKEWYAADAAPASTPSTPAASKPSKKDTASAPTATASTSKPADATGLCNDGSYYSGENKKGACRGHKGVKEWYGATTAAAPAPAPKSAPAATPAPTSPPAVATTPKPAPAAMPASRPAATPSSTPAPGGGNGQVWVNTSTKVYHCQGDRYYGTTKQGEYMSESDAVAKGDHPAHGKKCAS